MIRILFVLIATFILSNLIAQEIVNNKFIYKPNGNSDTLGKVIIYQDPAIETLLKKKIAVNEVITEINGFRVQIFSVSGVNSKDKANKAKAEFLIINPKAMVYLVYNEPYFKIRIGDFRTKLEAMHYMYSISEKYPFAFIVSDKVNIPVKQDIELEENNF